MNEALTDRSGRRAQPRVRLRAADFSDGPHLMEWRNDPETVRMSRHQRPVDADHHLAWLHKTLNDDSVRLYVAEDEGSGMSVGTGRLTRREESAVELSVTVAPHHRGRGYATAIIAGLVDRVGAEFPGISILRADVRAENAASLRAFARFDFVPARTESGIVELFTAITHGEQSG